MKTDILIFGFVLYLCLISYLFFSDDTKHKIKIYKICVENKLNLILKKDCDIYLPEKYRYEKQLSRSLKKTFQIDEKK